MPRFTRTLATIVLVVAVLVAGVRVGAGLADPVAGGLQDGLADCPSASNCVSSTSSGAALIAPLICADADPVSSLRAAIDDAGWTVLEDRVVEDSTYLHVVATTKILHFRDDVEFLIITGKDQIHVRSASRMGAGDLGANRTRINRLQADLDNRCTTTPQR